MPLRCVCGADYNHHQGLTSQCCRSPSQFSDPTQSPELFDPIEGEDWKLGFRHSPFTSRGVKFGEFPFTFWGQVSESKWQWIFLAIGGRTSLQIEGRMIVVQWKRINSQTKTVDKKVTQLTVEELTANLKTLVQHSFTLPKDSDNEKNNPILIGKAVQHRFEITLNGKTTTEWYTGWVISQVQQ